MPTPEFDRLPNSLRHGQPGIPEKEQRARFRERKLDELAKKSVRTNSAIDSRIGEISESITNSGFPFAGVSFGHEVDVHEGNIKRRISFKGDILEGTGISQRKLTLRGFVPLQQESVSLLIDPMGHGTEHGGRYSAKLNSELFHSNIRLRNEVINPWIDEFKKVRLRNPAEDPTRHLINFSKRLHDHISLISKKGGVMFGQGGLFYTRNLPLSSNHPIDPRKHFVELLHIPFGSESFIIQGQNVQRLAAGEIFNLHGAGYEFAANYGLNEVPHHKIADNMVIGALDQEFEAGKYIFFGGSEAEKLHLFFASDGLLDEENANGIQFKKILVPALPRIFEHAKYPENINLNIMDFFKKHLGDKKPSDDTTFAVQQLH